MKKIIFIKNNFFPKSLINKESIKNPLNICKIKAILKKLNNIKLLIVRYGTMKLILIFKKVNIK